MRYSHDKMGQAKPAPLCLSPLRHNTSDHSNASTPHHSDLCPAHAGSPAIDAGSATLLNGDTTDQRGLSRIVCAFTDMGAVEGEAGVRGQGAACRGRKATCQACCNRGQRLLLNSTAAALALAMGEGCCCLVL